MAQVANVWVARSQGVKRQDALQAVFSVQAEYVPEELLMSLEVNIGLWRYLEGHHRIIKACCIQFELRLAVNDGRLLLVHYLWCC
jgi:hypothetical protein